MKGPLLKHLKNVLYTYIYHGCFCIYSNCMHVKLLRCINNGHTYLKKTVSYPYSYYLYTTIHGKCMYTKHFLIRTTSGKHFVT